jgi:hypothetical protein
VFSRRPKKAVKIDDKLITIQAKGGAGQEKRNQKQQKERSTTTTEQRMNERPIG